MNAKLKNLVGQDYQTIEEKIKKALSGLDYNTIYVVEFGRDFQVHKVVEVEKKDIEELILYY